MRAYQKAWDRRKKYGLTNEQVDAMEAAQDGQCPICTRALRRDDPDTEKPVRICIDHDHLAGAVRSLLCDPCNKLLGHADDDPDRLRAAAAYLDAHARK